MDGERAQRATVALLGVGELRPLWRMGKSREHRDLPKVTQTVHALDPSPILAPHCCSSTPSPGPCGGLSVNINGFCRHVLMKRVHLCVLHTSVRALVRPPPKLYIREGLRDEWGHCSALGSWGS